jgi:RNA polymerase sigma factor (sigma-70 family)
MTLKNPAQVYDELLVLKCQQGNKDAFDELVTRWQKRLWLYAFQVIRSESATWDIIQETWLAIIKGLNKLSDVAVFPRWVFKILNNKCVDYLRREQLHSRVSTQIAEQAKNEPSDKQNNDDVHKSLWAAIEKLSPDQRALLSLRYQQGFDMGQIAEILAVPEGTVKSRLHRSLTELRQLMGVSCNG